MNKVQLYPLPGQQPSVGLGTVVFESANAPLINFGEPYQVILDGEAANVNGVGMAAPWASGYTYGGSTGPFGGLTIPGVCDAAGPHSIFEGPFMIATGILPSGKESPFGCFKCQYGAPVAPPAPPSPGIDAVVAAVLAGMASHVPVASIADLGTPANGELPSVQLVMGTQTVTDYLFTFWQLTMAASQRIATLLGGSVFQAPTPYWKPPQNFQGTVPGVNWISAPGLGSSPAADIMLAFGANGVSLEGGGPATLKAAILACFQPSPAPAGGAQ